MSIQLALPSKGSLGEASLQFLSECGFSIRRNNARQYTAKIKDYSMEVLFQRALDIPQKISEGKADLGITGLDIVRELRKDHVEVLIPNLGYGYANLVLAVPKSWVHVQCLYDLADLSAKWQIEYAKPIRVATRFKRLTEEFLYQNHIYNYSLVEVPGVVELAPRINVADIIVDLQSTGKTLEENQLKTLNDSCIIRSQACLIGNSGLLSEKKNSSEQKTLEQWLDHIESHLRAKKYIQFHAQISTQKQSKQQIERELKQKIFSPQEIQVLPYQSPDQSQNQEIPSLFHLQIIIHSKDLYSTLRVLRTYSLNWAYSIPIDFFFLKDSEIYQNLALKQSSKKEE